MNSQEILNDQLRAIMRARKMQGQEVAAAAGMARKSLSRKLNGLSPWTVDDLIAVARVLDIGVLIDVRDGYAPIVLLPRLDSNQEPTGYRLPAVAA